MGDFSFTSVRERFAQFTYLGTELHTKPNIRQEVQKILSAGNKCLGALRGLINNKNVTRKFKVKINKQLQVQ